MAVARTDTDFLSHGVRCRGWLFRREPEGSGRAGCIVMAHGFGGTRDAGLEPFARGLAEDGHAVLVFDYRHFGSSDGAPRQLLSVERQLEDWQAAIDHARTLPFVDPAKIGLWGSSFSGGHVIAAAVADGRVAAVTAQCPMMDGLAASLAVARSGGLAHALRVSAHGLLDLLRAAVSASPHYLPIVGEPGTAAAMSTSDALRGVQAIAPEGFVNEVAARICVLLARYRPGLLADRLPCPILIQVCEHDSVAPASAALAAAARAGERAELKRYPIGHFDIYTGEAFERSSADQRDFFRRHLA